MNKYILYISLLIFPLLLNAQESVNPVELITGPEQNMTNNIMVPMIFGHDSWGYYAYNFDYREKIVKYDHNFERVGWRYIDLSQGTHQKKLLALYHFHDSIYMFSSFERTNRVTLYVETIDRKSLKQNGDERVVMDVKNVAGWTAHFKFKLSRKHDRLLIYSVMDAMTKKFQDLHLEMYGEGFQKEWEADQRIVYRGRRPRESIIKVSDEGDAFILSLKDEQGLRSLWQDIKNRYTLVAVTDSGNTLKAYTLNLPELYIRGVQIEPGGLHDCSIVGFYSPTHSEGMIDGMFYLDLDNESGNFINRQYHEFESWFLQEAITGVRDKNAKEMFDYLPNQLIRRNSGDLIFIAENQLAQSYETYLNLLVVNFGPAGVEKWKRIIPKMQGMDRTTVFNYSSYTVHAPWYNDQVHLIFNDHFKNSDWPREEEIKSFHHNNKSKLKIVGIGPMGEMYVQNIYQKTRKNMKTPMPVNFYDMRNENLVIPAMKLKRFNYMKLTFN